MGRTKSWVVIALAALGLAWGAWRLLAPEKTTPESAWRQLAGGWHDWIWDGTESSEVPTRLWNAINDPDTLIYAFNANFERLIIKYVMGLDLPIERFRCTMVQAYGLCFAGSLADVGEQLGISKAKLTEGKELIKLFCTPRKPTKKKPWTRTLPEHEPEKWEAFKSYCIRDVDAEHEVLQKIDD